MGKLTWRESLQVVAVYAFWFGVLWLTSLLSGPLLVAAQCVIALPLTVLIVASPWAVALVVVGIFND